MLHGGPAETFAAKPKIAVLTVITAVGTLGMHILIPALPDMARDFGTTGTAIQLTITVYMLGLACGQVFYGAISDKFGRKPVLIVGLLIYCIGMALAVPAQSVGALLAARFLQAIGACAGLVLGRAMVQDAVGTGNATGRLAVLTVGLTVTPAVAPIVGQVVTDTSGWRTIFVLLCGAGLVLTIWCMIFLKETNTRLIPKLDFAGMKSNFRFLLRSREFLGFAIGGTSVTVTGFVFVASMPFIITDQLDLPTAYMTWAYVLVTAAFTCGALVARFLSSQLPSVAAARLGSWATVGASGPLLILSLSTTYGYAAAIGPMLIFTFGAGFASPNAMGGAMRVAPWAIGSASSLFGAIQMAVGAALTALPNILGSQSLTTLATIMLATTLTGQAMLSRIRSEKFG